MKLQKLTILAAILLPYSSAWAGVADSYVKSLQGKWRGGGTLTINDQGKKIKLRCATTNTLNAEKRTLVMKGRCASSSGTRSLRGTLRYSNDGARLTKVSFSLAGRSAGTHASLKRNTMTLRGDFKDDSSGRTFPSRTHVTSRGGRLSIKMQSRRTSGWKNHGTLSFKR